MITVMVDGCWWIGSSRFLSNHTSWCQNPHPLLPALGDAEPRVASGDSCFGGNQQKDTERCRRSHGWWIIALCLQVTQVFVDFFYSTKAWNAQHLASCSCARSARRLGMRIWKSCGKSWKRPDPLVVCWWPRWRRLKMEHLWPSTATRGWNIWWRSSSSTRRPKPASPISLHDVRRKSRKSNLDNLKRPGSLKCQPVKGCELVWRRVMFSCFRIFTRNIAHGSQQRNFVLLLIRSFPSLDCVFRVPCVCQVLLWLGETLWMLWQAVCHCHDEARLALWILWAYAAFFEGAFETLGFVPQQDGYSNAWGKL